MKRKRQTLEEIIGTLSEVESVWQDDRARDVIRRISEVPDDPSRHMEELARHLEEDFDSARLMIQLFLDISKDRLDHLLRDALRTGGTGVKSYRNSPETFMRALVELGLPDKMKSASMTPVRWQDILIERLKSGRGSAIRGQSRGRYLEDFVEKVVKDVFGESGYRMRCRFRGVRGESSEKTDIAIPAPDDPHILIESKAYGATGSKQTDILGDIARIVEEKRDDTTFLLVTDGVTWLARKNDLRKLVDLQNQGKIARIYTMSMKFELEADLRSLKREHSL